MIERAVRARFRRPPSAIIMTHGHFDHIGCLLHLAHDWNVPIYCQSLEVPYLAGSASYPPPDPNVGGGLMSSLSPLFPRGPIDVSRWLNLLPADQNVPFLPGWRWLHTPGHTPGHISLWREADRTLLAGDAFITTRQESAYAVTIQKPELHGPPMYYTPDWIEARDSVVMLSGLEPELILTGHGPAMKGPVMRTALHALAASFDEVAIPPEGKYVKNPAGIGSGREYAPARSDN
jgi:glyoxylase-like metal-dependent hydrolase (beta-lactamase superfamily II)